MWKTIPFLKNKYAATESGRIKRISSGKELRFSLNHKGYMRVTICKQRFMVHRLIAQTFIPNTENKPQVNHKNGIKSDNRVENLEWCTCQENINHAVKTGLYRNHNRVGLIFKPKDIIDIRNNAERLTIKQLSIKYHTTEKYINKIINKEKWKNIAPELIK